MSSFSPGEPGPRLTIAQQRSLETAVRRARLLDQLTVDLAKARTRAVAHKGEPVGGRWDRIARELDADILAVRNPSWRP